MEPDEHQPIYCWAPRASAIRGAKYSADVEHPERLDSAEYDVAMLIVAEKLLSHLGPDDDSSDGKEPIRPHCLYVVL